MPLEFILLPPVGAVIGFVTNALAIRMVFRPRHPVRVPLLGITIQGLLPRRQNELARSIGEAVQQELLPIERLLDRLDTAALKAQVVEAVVTHVDERVGANFPRFLPGNLRSVLLVYLKELVARETNDLMDKLTDRFRKRVRDEVDVAELVEGHVRDLDLNRLEGLALQVASRELRHIVYWGAVLGFFIGLLQAAALLALRRIMG